MTSVTGFNKFYQNIASDSNDGSNLQSHFNLIAIEDLRLSGWEPSYDRRSFFKVSMVNGHSKIHHANQSMEIKAVMGFCGECDKRAY